VLERTLADVVIRPDAAIFTLGQPMGDDVATVPVARLWDTDQYTGGNPDVTVGNPTIGLAEYSNANFFSDDTIFGEQYAFPASTSVELGPAEAEPKTGQLRRYFRKVRDGEPVEHLAVPSALFEALPDALKDRKKGLDDRVFRDYGEKLLPRAVGYSAALLDYFFRGKLDIDLIDNAADPALVSIEGTNASPEALGPGVFKTYVEDARGERRESAGGAATLSGTIDTDAPLPPLAAAVPPDTRRVVVTYQGRLGDEAAAVVGKVIETPIVEQLYWTPIAVGDQFTFPWFLRTPDDVYLLPFEDFFVPGTSIEQVRWGAQDNVLVAQTRPPDGDPLGLAFTVFRLDRDEGSRTVPTTGARRYGHPVAALARLSTVPLSDVFAVDLGTVLRINHTQILRSNKFTFDEVHEFRWTIRPDGRGSYVQQAPRLEHPSIEPSATVPTYSESVGLRLDPDHLRNTCGEGGCVLYGWTWEDMTVTDSGDVLLLVAIHESALPGNKSIDPFTPPLDSGRPDDTEKLRGIAWVNASQRTLVAKSMSDSVTLGHTTISDGVGIERHVISVKTGGGPEDGIFEDLRQQVMLSEFCGVNQVDEVGVDTGVLAFDFSGLYGPEFRALGLETDYAMSTTESSRDVCLVRQEPLPGSVPYTLRVTTRTHFPAGASPYGMSSVPGMAVAGAFAKNVLTGMDALKRVPLAFTRRAGNQSRLVIWDAVEKKVTPVLDGQDFTAATGNQRWATVRSDATAYVASIEGARRYAFSVDDVFTPGRFTLVAPTYLFSSPDGRFYRIGGTLTKSALPRALAPVSPEDEWWVNSSGWEYHVVR
jgi:hypothetical protein